MVVIIFSITTAYSQDCIIGTCTAFPQITTITPGTTTTVSGAHFLNTDPNNSPCNFEANGTLESDNIPGLSFVDDPIDYAGATYQVPFDVVFEVQTPIDVDASYDGVTRYGTEDMSWRATDICPTNANELCVIPTSESFAYQGCSNQIGNEVMATWHHTLDDVQANFEGRGWREDANEPNTVYDQCFEKAADMGLEPVISQVCPKITQLTGWAGIFVSNQTNPLDPDTTGYSDNCITAYKDNGVAPCGALVWQPMLISCLDEQGQIRLREYHTHRMIAQIPATPAFTQRHGKWAEGEPSPDILEVCTYP